MKKMTVLIIIFSLFLIFPFLVNAQEEQYTIFTSTECPYCQEVRETVSKEGYDKELEIQFLDIDNNEENMDKYFIAKANCGYDISDGAWQVPMAYDGQECVFGSVLIVQDLANRTGNQVILEGTEDAREDVEEYEGESTAEYVETEEYYDPPSRNLGIKEFFFIIIPPLILGLIAYILIFKMKL